MRTADRDSVNFVLALTPPPTGLQLGASVIVEGHRTFFVPFSIVSQVDGLMSVLLRVRVERDVYARDEQASACRQYGCEQWRSWSTFCGWFFSGIEVSTVKRTIAKAAQHLALGVFVVPVLPEDEWYVKLAAGALLRFEIPVFEVGPVRGSAPLPPMIALVLSFGYIGRLKPKRRPERDFVLSVIDLLDMGGAGKIPAIGYQPVCWSAGEVGYPRAFSSYVTRHSGSVSCTVHGRRAEMVFRSFGLYSMEVGAIVLVVLCPEGQIQPT